MPGESISKKELSLCSERRDFLITEAEEKALQTSKIYEISIARKIGRINNCEFLASYGVIFQSDIQSYFEVPVCDASLP